MDFEAVVGRLLQKDWPAQGFMSPKEVGERSHARAESAGKKFFNEPLANWTPDKHKKWEAEKDRQSKEFEQDRSNVNQFKHAPGERSKGGAARMMREYNPQGGDMAPVPKPSKGGSDATKIKPIPAHVYAKKSFEDAISDLPVGWQNYLIKAREAELQKDLPAEHAEPKWHMYPQSRSDAEESINQQRKVGEERDRPWTDKTLYAPSKGAKTKATNKLPIRPGTPAGYKFEGIHKGA